jgi:beta-N-acetylhexosaminidase
LRLATELAARSVTLVRNDDALVPLRLGPDDRVLSLEPEPSKVTPADTMDLYPPSLASSLRPHHPSVTEIVYPHHPASTDIAGAVAAAQSHDLVVVGTVNAASGQADLVSALLGAGKPVVTVALRAPYDLLSYPDVRTHLSTYSGHEPSVRALAALLFEGKGGHGRLPVAIPGLHPLGHGLTL